jgi:hypothetical protein
LLLLYPLSSSTDAIALRDRHLHLSFICFWLCPRWHSFSLSRFSIESQNLRPGSPNPKPIVVSKIASQPSQARIGHLIRLVLFPELLGVIATLAPLLLPCNTEFPPVSQAQSRYLLTRRFDDHDSCFTRFAYSPPFLLSA